MGTFWVTPKASAGIREWSCTGQWISPQCKIEPACHVSCQAIKLASQDRMSYKLPISVGVGIQAALTAQCLALKSFRLEKALMQSLLPELTCKMSLLWDAPPVAKIFVLGTARIKEGKKKKRLWQFPQGRIGCFPEFCSQRGRVSGQHLLLVTQDQVEGGDPNPAVSMQAAHT